MKVLALEKGIEVMKWDNSCNLFPHLILNPLKDKNFTLFRNTNLENADFRTSYNYSIDPELNRIKKAKFSLLSVSGLLDRYDIEIEK